MSATAHLTFPNIDPVIFEVGPLALRWYGLMYLVGFAAAFWLASRRLSTTSWSKDQLTDLLFWCFVGVILGGRVGYVFFYNFSYWLDDPLYLLRLWEGGMSFHGGCLGVVLAAFLFAKKQSWSFLSVGDFIAPLVPVGLGAGRLGNFINGELWGRVTDVPWAFVFPNAGPDPRHPSQLYQFASEGVLLFIIVWLYSAKPRPTGSIGGMFLACYGTFRFITEFFREPDAHLGLYSTGLSQGQILSIPMIIAGVCLIVYAYKNQKTT